ncbi:MAG: 2-hydroxyacyl-CoA dehydratase [Oscillospiraceae bacterium]|nr:2-hydroxyacyl-CoA dehydratase [Oscillospiraceae bacterium]
MSDYAIFTPEMKRTHTILVPNMLPIHFKLIISIFESYGYHCELLESESRAVVDEGLKNVHNDTCYPALLVIGQFMEALNSGRYDPDKTALMITQTGGGCRASNYIHLLRKCMAEHYPQVPVISLNFVGLEKDPRNGWQLTIPMIMKSLYGVLYGDLLMSLYNQSRAYELIRGSAEKVLKKWQRRLEQLFRENKYLNTKKIYKLMIDDFGKIERSSVPKIRVGIVGEIYVKYSPLANNHLEDFLLSEGCEPVVPSLLEFILYWAYNKFSEVKLYDRSDPRTPFYKAAYKIFLQKQKEVIRVMKADGRFTPPHDFEELRKSVSRYINLGVNMGEGWLIPAEMGALAESGTENIICAQPFGCLPNHIIAKGMSRAIKEYYPQANIIAIDYDPGATRVNQENRIKLMLANARAAQEATV